MQRDTEQMVGDESGFRDRSGLEMYLWEVFAYKARRPGEIAKGVSQVEKNTRSKI